MQFESTDSSNNCAAGVTNRRKVDYGRVLSEAFVKIPQKEALASSCKAFSCEDAHHITHRFFEKYTKLPMALSQNNRIRYVLERQTKEMLQSSLAETKLKDEVYTLSLTTAMPSHSNTDLNVETFQRDFNSRGNMYLPISGSATSDIKSAVAVSSEVTLPNKSKEKERVISNRKQLDFFEALKVKLQQKDTETQQIQLLLPNHHEPVDAKELSMLKDVEAKLTAERLKCEEHKNFDITKMFYQMFEDLREKLSIAKSNNEHFVKQLKALLEKYERLKKRADTIKEQLLEERTKRKWCQKALKRAAELKTNQAVLEEQADTACKKKMQTTEEKHNKYVWTLQRFDKERSAMIAEQNNLKVQLYITQKENQKLKRALQSKELKKRTAEKNLQGSQKLVRQLYEELHESKMQRKSTEEKLEAMEAELKRAHSRFTMETIQLQGQIKSSMEHFEAKRRECEALNELVTTLKTDKNMLKEELQCLQKSDTASKREGQKLKEAVSVLERERKLLLEEMGDLRKDYFSLSDRIAQRLGQLEQTDGPLCITDLSSDYHNRTSKEFNTAGLIIYSTDMIEHIKRKLEKEENMQQK